MVKHYFHRTLLLSILLSGIYFLTLGCTQSNIEEIAQPSPTSQADESLPANNALPAVSHLVWSTHFEMPDWMETWHMRRQGAWGQENLQVVADITNKFGKILRVAYPVGSASPTATRNQGSPVGGGQFYADLHMLPSDALRLSYYVRFSNNFDFAKGGKLPGLFGGTVTSGGNIPDGTNGFSTRFMWRRDGAGEIYAYLPSSKDYGTSIGRGNWQFQPGVWHHIEQQIILNQPQSADGSIQVWFNGAQVLNQSGLIFRTTQHLQIEGIFFSTFFGGNDASWATPQDVYIDFADFSMSSVN